LKRYRLRFLLQEFDLVRTVTIIGRSPDCHVTIEDPLVSRQHAQIMLDEQGASLEDLKSRNGVKVNGRPIRGRSRLKDGDRLRIGTQELVFCEMKDKTAGLSRTTGFLRHCANCHMPYPQELTVCPTCGSSNSIDEDTMTGELAAMSEHSWSVQLLVEVLDRAIKTGRTADAHRTLQRIGTQIDERLAAGGTLDKNQLGVVASAAVRGSLATSDAGWVAWISRVYARAGAVPAKAVIEAIAELAMGQRATVRPALEELIVVARSISDAPTDDLARLEQLIASIDLAERITADVTATNPAIR